MGKNYNKVATPYNNQKKQAKGSVAKGQQFHQVIIHSSRNEPGYNHYTSHQPNMPHPQNVFIRNGDQPSTVYQSRAGPAVGPRAEIPRQYVQTTAATPHGPTQTTSGSAPPQQQQVVIQFHQGAGATKVIYQQPPTSSAHPIVDRRMNHVSQLQPPPPSSSSQHIMAIPQSSQQERQILVADRQQPQLPHHPHPQMQQRQKMVHPNARVAHAAPQGPPFNQQFVPRQDLIHDYNMYPDHQPVPDAFSNLLEQVHANGESPKSIYRRLKKQFKLLVYENECYQEELRNSQRHLLKLSRDKNFLLDRLLNYEPVEDDNSDDSDADSDATVEEKPKTKKKRPTQPRVRKPAAAKKLAAKEVKAEDDLSRGSITDSQPKPNSTPLPPPVSLPQTVEPQPSTSAEVKPINRPALPPITTAPQPLATNFSDMPSSSGTVASTVSTPLADQPSTSAAPTSFASLVTSASASIVESASEDTVPKMEVATSSSVVPSVVSSSDSQMAGTPPPVVTSADSANASISAEPTKL